MKWVPLLLSVITLTARAAYAGTAWFSLSIGYNGVPPAMRDSSADELRFADDDALAVHELARTFTRRSVVLTLPDGPTQARYPSSQDARPPSVVELRRALTELETAILAATRAGEDVSVWVFYSGHGWLDDAGRANLTLADGALSQRVLYDELLPALPARTVHLMIDACHAEALIRPRDVTAETVEVSAAEVATASLRGRLAAIPNLGVTMASASNTRAHEWDEYQTGVFTHELLSGLRGGADVNRDGRVEYSEIAAFMTAANRYVADPRARLTNLFVAPRLYPRAAIMDTRAARNVGRLQGQAHRLGRFQIDDRRGNRLLDLRVEPGFVVDVIVPEGEPLLLSSETGEARLVTKADRPVAFDEIVLETPRSRARGVVAESLRRGLFAAEFGPSYYRGFVDNGAPQIVSVDLTPSIAARTAPATRESNAGAWSAFAVGVASLAASAGFGIAAAGAYGDFQDARFERESIAARDRYERYGTLTLGSAVVAVLSGAVGYWMWHSDASDSGQRRR